MGRVFADKIEKTINCFGLSIDYESFKTAGELIDFLEGYREPGLMEEPLKLSFEQKEAIKKLFTYDRTYTCSRCGKTIRGFVFGENGTWFCDTCFDWD